MMRISDLYNKEEVTLTTPSFIWGDTNNNEQIELLCYLSKGKDVFEIGTYRGRTTNEIARYANKVVTFDWNQLPDEGKYHEYEVGQLYKENNRTNVTQVIGDSTTFDFTPYYNQFDLVYLDGGHTYEVAKNDFFVSYKLLKDKGIIVIDDATWEGVNKAMTELQSDYDIVRVGPIYYFEK